MGHSTFREDEPLNGLTGRIIGAAIEVHRTLGPGLLETTYERCLAAELGIQGLRVDRQVAVPIHYRHIRIDCGYRVDMLVEQCVVVELKNVREFAPVHISQVLTYLRFTGLRVGLLFNFNVKALAKGGIRRVLSSGPESTPGAPRRGPDRSGNAEDSRLPDTERSEHRRTRKN